MSKDMDFHHFIIFIIFIITLKNKFKKQLLDSATKTGLGVLKTAFRKKVHKAAGATGQFIGNKIAERIVKPKPVHNEILRYVEEIIPPEKTEKY